MHFLFSCKHASLGFMTLATAAFLAAAVSTRVLADPTPPASGSPPAAPATAPSIPAGAHLRFHLTAPLASNLSRAGDTFSFVILEPVAVEGHVLVAPGALGSGTVMVAGKSGNSGHEGDLTLRLDSVSATTRDTVVFADQKIEINGRNRKIMSGVLGFVPFAGLGSLFIHGSEIHIDTATPIETVLSHPATMTTTTSAVTPASE